MRKASRGIPIVQRARTGLPESPYPTGDNPQGNVFNDAGPVTVNLDPGNAAAQADIAARAADWQFGQFHPASCTDCSDMGQATAIIKWRLDNDTNIREAIYETDFDLTNRFFTRPLGGHRGEPGSVTEARRVRSAHPAV